MCGVLALLFIVVPAVEIIVIIEVGSAIGAMPTLAVIIATGIAGAALARSQGFAAMRQLRESLAQGRQVGRSLVEAALVLVAAVLMLTPGFLTDALGFALLVPPFRRVIANILVMRYAARAVWHVASRSFDARGPAGPDDDGRRGPGPGRQRGEKDRDDDDHEPPPRIIDV